MSRIETPPAMLLRKQSWLPPPKACPNSAPVACYASFNVTIALPPAQDPKKIPPEPHLYPVKRQKQTPPPILGVMCCYNLVRAVPSRDGGVARGTPLCVACFVLS